MDFLEGFVVDSDAEEGLLVKVFSIVEVDLLIAVYSDCEDYAVGVVGCQRCMRKVQLALMQSLFLEWNRLLGVGNRNVLSLLESSSPTGAQCYPQTQR